MTTKTYDATLPQEGAWPEEMVERDEVGLALRGKALNAKSIGPDFTNTDFQKTTSREGAWWMRDVKNWDQGSTVLSSHSSSMTKMATSYRAGWRTPCPDRVSSG